jgi:hypothetical protein
VDVGGRGLDAGGLDAAGDRLVGRDGDRPAPVALVVTGGTSWLPLSATLASTAEATPTPIATRIAITPNIAKSVRLIACLLLLMLVRNVPPRNLRPSSWFPSRTERIVKFSIAWARRSEVSASAGVPARRR